MSRRPDGKHRGSCVEATADLSLEPHAGERRSHRLLDPPEDARNGASNQRTVVCGVDDGETARVVARAAAELSEHLAARLVLVHVAPSPAIPGMAGVPGAVEELRRLEAERAQERLTGLLPDAQQEAQAERRVAFGIPAAALEAVASQEGADLIVVGSRGRGGIASALFGSVSAALARSARCPVVVVGPLARSSS
jgi:nucleotide-binding universal stress UspA family protein